MAYTPPTVADFKSRFDRDFPFASADAQTDKSRVRDKDVTTALTQAGINFNAGLWENQAIYSEAYLLFTAHWLCTNLSAAAQGISGAGQWLTNSKAVGNVQEGYQIPDRVLKSPTLSLYSKTTYGCMYLGLIAPRLVGNILGVYRQAHAV